MGRLNKCRFLAMVVVAGIGLVGFGIFGGEEVGAAEYGGTTGGGGSGQGSGVSCSGASNAHTTLCDGGKWGGYNDVLYAPDTADNKLPYYRKVLSEDRTGEFKEQLNNNLFGIARGWVSKSGRQCGPLKLEGGIGGQIQYNEYGAVGLEEALQAIVNNTIPPEGLRLKQNVMEQLADYLANIGITIKDGYVVFDKSAVEQLLGKTDIDIPPDIDPKQGSCQGIAPSSYTGSNSRWGDTSSITLITNNRIGGWAGQLNGGETIYARPGDDINWLGCYFPGAQRTIETEVTIKHGAHNASENPPNENWMIGKGAKAPRTYNNSYDVKPDGTTSSNSFPGPGGGGSTPGIDKILEWSYNKTMQKTSTSDVGKTYRLQMKVWSPVNVRIWGENHEWDCDGKCCIEQCKDEEGNYIANSCCVRHSHDEAYVAYEWDDGPRYSWGQVDVPYNFINTASVEVKQKDLVYSGNNINVKKADVKVGTRSNGAVRDTYATQVDDAVVKLIAYVSARDESGDGSMTRFGVGNCGAVGGKQCWDKQWSGSTLNSGNNLSGSTDSISEFTGTTWNVFDASAGDYMCFRLSVYPASSGWDTNMSSSGDGMSYYSKPSCVIIAKRPSFEIYGGSLYSAGSVTATYMQKYNVRDLVGKTDLYKLEPSSKENGTVFGSWVEQSVVTNGANKWLASGAARGLRVDKNGKAIGGNFSLGKTEYCLNQAPLSMSNYGDETAYATNICPNVQVTGYANVGNDISSGIQDRKELVDFWGTGEVNTDADEITLVRDDINETYSKINSATGKRIYYIYGKGKMTITEASSISKSATYIVRTDEDIVIADDIIYNAGTTTMYTSSGQIPKVVIYAKNNIKISCSVKRIDAILIAGKTVDTCMESAAGEEAEDVNSKLRSNRLHIRGMVIANKINLGRTYGSAAGYYSNTPAESINYDTSAILWGRYMSGSAESDTLTTVYQHETAPRY